MALIKKHDKVDEVTYAQLHGMQEALDYFHEQTQFEAKAYALEEMISYSDGPQKLVELLKEHESNKEISSRIASILGALEPSRAPIEEIMELLKLHNAYIRNLAIVMLQNYGDAIKYYIVKFLIGDDRDLRIFAINVLGDVNFVESREMLLELLEHEEDVNVAMTAVDYLAEIGEPEDVTLLETLKQRFNGDAYVNFAIDGAISSIKG